MFMSVSRQRYWSGWPFPPPGDLSDPEMELACVSDVSCIGRRVLYHWASLIAQLVKNQPAMQETPVRFLGWENPLEKG